MLSEPVRRAAMLRARRLGRTSGRPEDIGLVVEDDHHVRTMTVQLLHNLGYTALAREVRRRWPDTRIMFTTGYAPEHLFDREGPDETALLRKPVTQAQLGRAMADALKG